MDQQKVLNEIVRFYLNSGDFNGYPVETLRTKFGLDTGAARQLLGSMLNDDQVEVWFGNLHPNPHIKAFSTVSKNQQLKFLEELPFGDHVCVYPSATVLQSVDGPRSYRDRPFSYELALGAGQLDFRTFDLSVLEHYRNDPRYSYHTDFIHGAISVRDEYYASGQMAEGDKVLLQTFGFAFDENYNRSVAVFLRYLSKLSAEHQQIWKARMVEGKYKLHPDYYRTSILGEWSTRLSIFDAFREELRAINSMCALMGSSNLFRDTFDDPPKGFGFLLRSTLSEFNDFVHLLDKMMSDNINRDFFAGQLNLEDEVTRDDGKIVVQQKGTIRLLQEWLERHFKPHDPNDMNELFSTFRDVRKLRQKPAHAVNQNVFDLKYSREQRLLVIRAYYALRTIRLVFSNHPEVKKTPPEISTQLFNGEIWEY